MRVALPWRRRVVAGAVALSVVMGFQGSFTWQSHVGISAISLVALWFGLGRPRRGRRTVAVRRLAARPPMTTTSWAVLSILLYAAIFGLAIGLHFSR